MQFDLQMTKTHPSFECYDLLKPFHQHLPQIEDGTLHKWLMDFLDHGTFDQITPTRLMRQFREDIKDPDIFVAVVTARAWMGEEVAQARTIDWFKYEGIDEWEYGLVIPNHGENKATALISYYNNLNVDPEVIYVADDVEYNLNCFNTVYGGTDCKFVMPSKPWNRNCTRYCKIDVGGLIHG